MEEERIITEDKIPVEEAYEIIKNWSYRDIEGLMKMLVSLWRADRAKETRPGLWVFSTGGSYENEVLLHALKKNFAWNIIAWDSLEFPGGFLIVATSKSAKKELERKKQQIVEWAWNKQAPKKDKRVRRKY
jgi:hypothetical protein